ncbi:MAG: GFA family protein [Gammaproteobacteria bacterium]|nr:GFA family protein [Gammaproteobacteria bacterium]
MKKYHGSCHCGSISYTFTGPEIVKGLRCNCSVCVRKGAVMTAFIVAPEAIDIEVIDDSLSTYQFGSNVAKHHYCKKCGIYPFHQTMRKPGHYRINLGCVDGVKSLELPVEIFDGASL